MNCTSQNNTDQLNNGTVHRRIHIYIGCSSWTSSGRNHAKHIAGSDKLPICGKQYKAGALDLYEGEFSDVTCSKCLAKKKLNETQDSKLTYRQQFGLNNPPPGTMLNLEYLEGLNWYLTWDDCPDGENIIQGWFGTASKARNYAEENGWLVINNIKSADSKLQGE